MFSCRSILMRLIVVLVVVKMCKSLTSEQIIELDTLVRDVFMAQNKIPGVGVTIVENSGNSVFAKGYGYANIESNITANENTKFCIASISKTFTATLVMKVLSETFPELGSTVLETPLRILHPKGNFTFSDRFRYESMSFRDLLSHRHGLRTESLGATAGAFKDIEELTFRSRYAPEVTPFRTGWFYSNTFYALAGKLIAEIAQEPFDTLLQNFFNQLGMNDSILINENTNIDLMANMSRGYFLKYGEMTLLNSSLINRVFVAAPAGGIITTSNDMAKYISFHLNNGRVGNKQVISEQAMMWLRQPAGHLNVMQFKSINSSIVAGIYAMGTGFHLGVYDGWEYLGHPGQWTTFMSELRIYPQLGLGTFSVNNGPSHIGNAPYNHRFLQNSIFSIINGLSCDIESHSVDQNFSRQKIVGQKMLKKRTSSQNMTEESFVGVFGNAVEGDVEITSSNGSLYFRFGTWATGYLIEYPHFPNTYTVTWDSDFVQDIYFSEGGLVDVFIQFEDVNTLMIIFDDVYIFRRGKTVDTLPIIPWNPESCGPNVLIGVNAELFTLFNLIIEYI